MFKSQNFIVSANLSANWPKFAARVDLTWFNSKMGEFIKSFVLKVSSYYLKSKIVIDFVKSPALLTW